MNPEVHCSASSIVEPATLEPYVKLQVGSSIAKITPKEAMEYAVLILDAANTALAYAFVTGFIHKQTTAQGSKPDLEVMRELITQLAQFKGEMTSGKKMAEIINPTIKLGGL